MRKVKYRIVTDNYLGFEVQKKVWFWPFWFQLDNLFNTGIFGINTYPSIEQAEKLIDRDKNGKKVNVVKYY